MAITLDGTNGITYPDGSSVTTTDRGLFNKATPTAVAWTKTGVAIPDDVTTKRAAARMAII